MNADYQSIFSTFYLRDLRNLRIIFS